MRPALKIPVRQARSRQAGFTLIEVLISMLIMSIITTMLVGIWIVLLHTSAFAEAENTAAATGRDSLDRVSAELRAAQPNPSGTPAAVTPFVTSLSAPYVCDADDCTFYSAYNNSAVYADGSGSNPGNGTSQLRLTSIWLDPAGTTQRKLHWTRDTNNDGILGDTVAGVPDKTFVLANNVVDASSSISRPVFTYVFRDKTGTYTTANTLTSATVANLVAINIEIIIDANLTDKPAYVDFVSTVRPRNVASSN
jgi:prepilin-type N-terminal cleavage/methylation domain-containing protein